MIFVCKIGFKYCRIVFIIFNGKCMCFVCGCFVMFDILIIINIKLKWYLIYCFYSLFLGLNCVFIVLSKLLLLVLIF